ncbi:hypothetical protein L1280_001884 [Deinococcus sp. HSC-46F16]|uniref:hypothetical protein n=1 Tax=Deinococcus sp. HSC-46F16 TaxID=2910968 RepID=UPI00209F6985|nr:hypothetical protein [Deinococcus sp. HSC-46F16]MCP2014732.1 hypothetical protein [Deinococcus sp. HSC-46F16]
MRGVMATVGLALLGTAAAQGGCGGEAGSPSWVKSGVFHGTLGGQAVALELGPRDDGEAARYFYERFGVNIRLKPGRAGTVLLLREEVWTLAGTKVTGCLRLERAGAGLRGSWTSPDGRRTLPVSLAPLDVTRLPLNLPDSPGLRRLRGSDPLTFLKLNRAWVREAGGARVREPLSGVHSPRVPGGSAALNAALQDRQLEHAANALDCRAGLEGSGEDAYGVEAQVTLLRSHLVSLFENAGYYCGGAHPDNFDVGLILDRATGRPVPVTAIWPGLTPARLSTLYLARSGADAECREVLTGDGLELTAHLTPQGLALTPTGLPHVVAACAETVTLPLATLRAQAKSQGPYFRDLYPR